LLSYIRFFMKSKGAHGLQSPFVYDFYKHCRQRNPLNKQHKTIENIRQLLLKNNTLVSGIDYGKNPPAIISKPISGIAKTSLLPKKYCNLLHRICHYAKANTILELGSSFGISSMYLSTSSESAKVFTIEGNAGISEIAKTLFRENAFNTIELSNEQIEIALPRILSQFEHIDFVYFDGNHRYEATMEYFRQCLQKKYAATVFVFDDIHSSKEMETAWEEIAAHREVSLSIDIFRFGILFFMEGRQKEHFCLRL